MCGLDLRLPNDCICVPHTAQLFFIVLSDCICAYHAAQLFFFFFRLHISLSGIYREQHDLCLIFLLWSTAGS